MCRDGIGKQQIMDLLFQAGEVNHRLALPHKLFDAMLAGLPVIAPDFATEVVAVVRARLWPRPGRIPAAR